MLTEAWTPLRYHPAQSRLWRTKSLKVAVAAGRGSGKTELAKRRLVRFLPVVKPWVDPRYFYAAPTYAQAKRISWEHIKRLVPKSWVVDVSETELSITTVFGSKLHVLGMDKPERAEGVQWDGGVLDESSDQKPKVFDLSILPALTHRDGWIWRIGVPKRYGIGAAEFRSLFRDENYETYTWPSRDILPASKIEEARKTLDSRDFAEQFEADWVTAGGLAFYGFDERRNIRKCRYRDDRPILVGSDFNVDPMAWTLAHQVDDGLEVFDEIWLRDTNTRSTMNVLHDRYKQHKGGWYFYGDATGKARKTAATKSDYIIIKSDDRFKGNVSYPDSNPLVKDRLASCNALLEHARVHIDPDCKNLISDLEMRAVDKTGNPDDSGDLGHITDALGYMIHSLYPVTHITAGGTSLSVVSNN